MDTNQDFGSLLNNFSGSGPSDQGDGFGSLLTPRQPARQVADTPVGGGNVDEFVKSVTPAAQRVAQRLNVPVEAVIGQWGLETGWGKSVIPGTNNLGNIKGRGVAATDNMTGSRDEYRQYGSVDEFADDFTNLVGNGRYKAVSGSRDPMGYFQNLKAAGYAEDPDYVAKGGKAAAMAAEALKRAGVEAPATQQGPDLSKAPKWADVEAKPEFAKLPPEKQAEAKAAYFDYWIAPRAGERAAELRTKFLTQATSASAPDERGFLQTAGDTARNLAAGVMKIGPTAVKGVADVGNMITGDTVDLGVSKAMQRGMDTIDETVASQKFNQQKKGFEAVMQDDSKGIGDMFAYMLDNPAILVDNSITTIGSMFLPVGVAKGAAVGARAAGMGTAAATKAAVAASIGTSAAQNAGDTFSTLEKQSLEDRYKGAAISAGVSILMGIATGGGAEGQIAKRLAGELQAGRVGLDVVKQFLKSVGKEAGQEAGEELGNIGGEVAGSLEAPSAVGAAKRTTFAGTLGGIMGGGAHIMTGGGSDAAPAPEPAAVTPDGRIEPTLAPEAHPTSQTADSIVAELATQAGVPLDTVLPTAPTEATTDQDVQDLAAARYQQLREKQNGSIETVIGDSGPVDQDMPGVGLSPAESQELAGLEQAAQDPEALRAMYGLDDEVAAAPVQESEADREARVEREAIQGEQSMAAEQQPAEDPIPFDVPAQPVAETSEPVAETAIEQQPAETQEAQAVAATEDVATQPVVAETATEPVQKSAPGDDIAALQKEVDDARAAWQQSHVESVGQRLRAAIAALEAATQPATPTAVEPVAEQPAAPAKPKTEREAKIAKALDRVARGTAYFSNESKAKEWVTANGLTDTHTVERDASGANKWNIVAKKETTSAQATETQQTETQRPEAPAEAGAVTPPVEPPAKPKTEKEAKLAKKAQGMREKADRIESAGGDKQVVQSLREQAERDSPVSNQQLTPGDVGTQLQYTGNQDWWIGGRTLVKPGEVVSVTSTYQQFLNLSNGAQIDRAAIGKQFAVVDLSQKPAETNTSAEPVEKTGESGQDLNAMFDEVLAEEVAKDQQKTTKPRTEKEAKAAKAAPTEDDLYSARAELKNPTTLDEFIGAVDAGYRAHFDYAGTDGRTVWIEKVGGRGWVMKSVDDDNKGITSTKGGAGLNSWDKLAAMQAAESDAKYRFTEWKPTAEAQPSKLVQAMNDLADVRQRIADQGQVVDDRLLQRERQLKAIVKELEAEGKPKTEKEAKAKKDITVTKAGQGATAIVIDPSAMGAQRTATQAAASAATNSAKALANAIDGLGALFGGHGKLSSGLSFDEQTYAKAKPLFQAAVANLGDAGKDIKEAMRAVVRMVMDKFGAQAVQNMKPYVVRFIEETSTATSTIAKPETTAQNDSNELTANQGQGQGDQGPRGTDQSGSGQADQKGVANSAPADVATPAGTGDSQRSGAGAASGDVGSDGRVSKGGDAANGRTGTGRTGVSADGAGKGRGNYHIADPEQLIGGTPKVRFQRNKKAIEALQSITSEGREPTKDDLDAMAGYIGWGSFGQELFKGTYDRPSPKDGWQKESDWLREHLGKSDWEAAQASIINAHYTDPITVAAMWDMVRQLGFTGGRVLEPSMGVGNFYGLMPLDLMARSKLAGIEMDPTTGGMAKLLYPEANIQIKPYQDSKTADGFYDLVIGNWPFAKDGPADRRYLKLSPSLHDYFFLKALDQTRAGGLVVGITSAGTMDKQGTLTRAALAEKADLVASFRLPSGAFEKYAGTSVVTDIIILKKRETPNADVRNSGWLQTTEVSTPSGQPIKVNEYYAKNRGNVLGTLNFGSGSTYGRPSMIVDRPADLEQRMAKLAPSLPTGVFQPTTTKAKTIQYVTNNTKDRQQSITEKDGALFQVHGEYLAPLSEVVNYQVKDAKKTAAREDQIKRLVSLRRQYGDLIDAERDGAADAEAKRKALSDAYTGFVSEHGPLNDSDGLAILKKVGDPFYPSLAALETANGQPASILSKPTMRAKKKLAKPTVRDALIMARNESVFIDMAQVAKLAGVKESAAAKELTEAGAVFQTPDGTYEVSDVYLSGNVRRKLREAEAAAEDGMNMARNIEALKKVLPADVPYFNIEAKMGATWIRPEQYKQFIEHLLGKESSGIEVRFMVNRWKVKFHDDQLNIRPEATTTWGAPGIKFDRLLSNAIGNVAVKIWARDSDGNKFVDEEASAEANEKANKIREEFSNWLWADPVRKIEMEKTYNEIMNAIADATFDGSFMTFEGMALQRGDSPFDMRSHQGNAVYRGLVNRRGIYAHEVGTGKTYTMGSLAIESRRYGIAKKPLILAHNANSASVAREIGEQYPGAKLLYIDNLNPEKISVTMRQIANDDWDAVVVPHSLMDRFTLKEETLMEISRGQIEALEQEAIEAAKEDGVGLTVEQMDDDDALKKVRSVTAKQLVHSRNQIIKKIKEMSLKSSKEGAISFEDMGIDMIIVDEAHEFKKPPLATRMSMKGLNKTSSAQSISLMFLTDYVKKLNGGTGVHLFTGTPITNTVNEIYNMMRFVMDDQMARDGVREWDAWFNTFADSTGDVELTAAGEYEPVTRLAAFVNVPELRRMVGQYMDIVFADDMPEFKPRSTKSGKTLTSENLTEAERNELLNGRTENPIGRPYKKIVNDVAEMSPEQMEVFDELKRRAASFKSASKKERKEIMMSGDKRNPVLVETAAANAGLDPRLYDMALPDAPGNKVNRVVRNVMQHYKEHAQATQVIFVDKGYTDQSVSRKKDKVTGQVTVEKKPRFNLVKDIVAKLVAQGIPESQIAVVDGSVSKEKRKAIADAMNRAEIRVVIGQTDTLGVGVNMQANLRAMHHMDAPWMPGELEQRNGRGHRQGNKWNTVFEHRYITERIDGRRWQVLSIKDRFIKSFMKADDSIRVIEGDAVNMDEDGDLGSTLSDAAGDPRLLMMNKLRADVVKLENKERMHAQGIFDARQKIESLRQKVKDYTNWVARYRKDLDKFLAVAKNDLVIEVGGRTFTDIEKANDAMTMAAAKVKVGDDPVAIAKVWGFTVSAYQRSSWVGIEFRIEGEVDHAMGKGTVESARATMYGIAKRIEKMESEVDEAKGSIPRMQEASKAPFARAADLEKKRKMLADLEADIQLNPVPAPSWLRNGAPINTAAFVDGKPVVIEGHRYTNDGYFVTVSEGDTTRNVPYMEVTDENGLPKYEEQKFEAPKIIEGEKGKPPVVRDITRSPAPAFGAAPEPVRADALAKLKGLEKKAEAGTLTEAEYRLGVQELIKRLTDRNDERNYRRVMAGRKRGADWIVAKMRTGVTQGTVSKEATDFAQWLLDQNPNVADDLGISVKTPKDSTTAGSYNPASQVFTLLVGRMSDETAVHEILHHTERMMPAAVQDGVLREWQRAWDAAYKKADPKLKAALDDMMASALGDQVAMERVGKAFNDGTLKYDDHYQLYSPSEFWAVNATRILSGRYKASGSWVARAAQWFKEFVQRAKGALGLKSDAPILKALKDVMAGDGKMVSNQMLVQKDYSGWLQEKDMEPGQAPVVMNDIVRRIQNNAIQFFGNRDKTPSLKTFGAYDKTLATQFHKALKDKHFGKVFAYVNAMQNEVSLTSIRPAELAPGVLPRVDDVKSAFKQLVKGKKADKNLEVASRAIFEGTLQVPDNVMAGTVWTKEEFMARPGATEAAWGLYQQSRAAIDASLDEVAAAEAYAMAQGFVPKGMRRQIIDNPGQSESMVVGEINRQIKTLDKAIKAATRMGADQQAAELEAAREGYLRTRRQVEKIFVTAKNLKAAGYAPLMRFGKFTVTVQAMDPVTGLVARDENGESITLFYGQYETEGEAKAVRAKMEAEYEGQDDVRIKAGTKSQTSHELYSGISPETLALFAEAIGADQAMRKHIELAMSERSALKRRLERKGTEGYSDDMPRVLSNFITSNGRHAAQRYYLRDLNNAIKYIPKEKGDVLDEAMRLKKFVMDPSDPAAPVSSIMFAWFLGGSVASAVVNLTQPVMMTAPYLSQFGPATAAKAVASAIPYAMGKKEISDADLRDALKRASREGIVDAQEIFHLYSVGAQGVASGLVNQLAKLPGVGGKIKAGSEDARARINAFLTLWGSMFSLAEGFNRKLTFIAAWDVAKVNGEKNPYQFAVRAVNETQGIYNKVNRPNWGQGPVGRTLLTFKQFSIMYVELLSRMVKNGGPEGKRAALVMLAVLMLAAGEEGLPFAQDLDDLIDTVGQMMGLDTNMKRWKRRQAHEIMGKELGDLFLYGASAHLPLDFSGRLGLGNLIPGTGLLKPSDSDLRGRNVAELFGPTAGMAGQIGDAYDAVVEGNTGKAVQNLSPKAVKDVLAAGEMAKKGYATDARGRKVVDVGLSDAAIKGIGFQPTVVARETRKTMPVYQDIAIQKRTESSIVNQWVRGLADNDMDMAKEAQQRLTDWNRRNPDTPIKITPDQIRNLARQMASTKDTRLLKLAPREMRGVVGLDLAE